MTVQVGYARGDAHLLLRRLVAARTGVGIDRVVLAHECPHCAGTDHGRPVVLAAPALRRPPQVSLARAGDLAVLAISDVGPVGIDVEAAGAGAGLDAVVGDERERDADPTVAWVRKESLLKACGLGLAVDPRDVRLGPPQQPPVRLGWRSRYPGPERVWMRDLQIPGHVAAVTVARLPAADRAAAGRAATGRRAR